MTQNKLYAVDTAQKTHCLVATDYGKGWRHGQNQAFRDFLADTNRSWPLIFIRERGDEALYDLYVKRGKAFNGGAL
jgi:hypothetical protein